MGMADEVIIIVLKYTKNEKDIWITRDLDC